MWQDWIKGWYNVRGPRGFESTPIQRPEPLPKSLMFPNFVSRLLLTAVKDHTTFLEAKTYLEKSLVSALLFHGEAFLLEDFTFGKPPYGLILPPATMTLKTLGEWSSNDEVHLGDYSTIPPNTPLHIPGKTLTYYLFNGTEPRGLGLIYQTLGIMYAGKTNPSPEGKTIPFCYDFDYKHSPHTFEDRFLEAWAQVLDKIEFNCWAIGR
jgi:hypothetical protein